MMNDDDDDMDIHIGQHIFSNESAYLLDNTYSAMKSAYFCGFMVIQPALCPLLTLNI